MPAIQDFLPFETALAINGVPVSMFGITHQTTLAYLVRPPQIRLNQAGGTPVTAFVNAAGYDIGYFSIQVSSGATAGYVAIGVRLANEYWKAGQLTAGGIYTDDTADAQSTSAADFPIESTTANDGCLISSPVPFNCISMNMGVASTGSPVRDMAYSRINGTWSAAVTPYVAGGGSTGEQVWLWDPAPDWAPMDAGHGTNVPIGNYGIRLRATTAPTAAAQANAIEVCRLFFCTGAVAASQVIGQDFGAKGFSFPGEGNGLVAFVEKPGSTVPSRVTGLWKLG